MGVRPQTWQNWKDRGTISEQHLLPYCQRRGISWEWLRTGTGPRDVPQSAVQDDAFSDVPLMSAKASAGGGLEPEEGVEGTYKFRRDWLSTVGPLPSLCLVWVSGESMIPTLQDGDMVMVDRSRRDPNGISLIRTREGISVKRVRRTDDKRVFVSDNVTDHPPRIVNAKGEDLEMLGRVVWMARKID